MESHRLRYTTELSCSVYIFTGMTQRLMFDENQALARFRLLSIIITTCTHMLLLAYADVNVYDHVDKERICAPQEGIIRLMPPCVDTHSQVLGAYQSGADGYYWSGAQLWNHADTDAFSRLYVQWMCMRQTPQPFNMGQCDFDHRKQFSRQNEMLILYIFEQ